MMAPQTRRKTLEMKLQFVGISTGGQMQKQQQKKKKNKQNKSKKNNSIKKLNILNEDLISLTPNSIKENNMQNKMENTSSKNNNEINGNDITSEDFIALNTGLSSFGNSFDKRSFRKKDTVETISVPENPVTITVDDDCCSDDSICISESEDNNDNIQIIKELVKSYNAETRRQTSLSKEKKRKLNDSIEICLEICNSHDNTAKRGKYDSIVSAQQSCATSSTNVSLEKQDKPQAENDDDDNDIVVVETVDKNVDDAVVVKDTFGNRQWPKNNMRNLYREPFVSRNRKSSGERCLLKTFVAQDKIGASRQQVARYNSPLRSIANDDSDALYYNKYGNNMYNPNSVQKSGLRPVVIDGSNIAYGHGGNTFSTRGIDICVNYFAKRGHWVVTFVPLFRRSEVSEADRRILDNLHRRRHLVFTPSRFLRGRRVSSYDDRFIVQCAAELGGIVVSTDNFRDLVVENEAWRETIEKRLLMFTWVGDILMFPDDPNGRSGPRLEEFLRFPQ